MPRRGFILSLIKRLEADPHPQRKSHIKREIAELLGPGVFYVNEGRFEPAEREEAVGEVEEVVVEEGLEPVGEVEEVVEDDEYLGQRVAIRVFPEERPRVRPPPVGRRRGRGRRLGISHGCDSARGGPVAGRRRLSRP
jgi:hypothetical protein